MTRFAGRVSAANYVAAGANAATQSSDMAEIARRNAPKYEKLTKEAMAQDAKNFVAAEANKSRLAQRATVSSATVRNTEMALETQKAADSAKRSGRKAGLVAKAAALGASALKKTPERPVRTIDTSFYDKRIAELRQQGSDIRSGLDDITNEEYVAPSSKDTPSSSGSSNVSSENLKPSERGLQLMNDLVGDGYTPEQAAGIAGNAQYESANFTAYEEYSPNVYGTKGAGMIQWTNTPGDNRRDQFENWAKGKGLDPSSYQASAGYLLHEIKGGSGNKWTAGNDSSYRQIGDLETAVTTFQNDYLRPNPDVANTSQRLSNARNLLGLYNSQSK